MNEKSLLSQEEVAKEILQDLDHTLPQLITMLNSGDLDSIDDLFVSLQSAKISTYNMHLKLQGKDFPINSLHELRNSSSVEELINWLRKNHPEFD